MMTQNKQLQATVYGRVQGVFFRDYTQREAKRLGVVGWVANHRDGTVRVTAEGPEPALAALVEFLYQGSPSAHVNKVEVTWHEATGDYSQFQVRWF
jgi:acylphosphatase